MTNAEYNNRPYDPPKKREKNIRDYPDAPKDKAGKKWRKGVNDL